MLKPKNTIGYDPYSLPPRTFWDIDSNLPRLDIAKLCRGLDSIINEKHGVCFYYPDMKASKTDCRYEWQIPYKGKKFGLRLCMRFSVGNNDLKSIEASVAYGDQSDKLGQPPSFTQKEIEIFHQVFLSVMKDALFRSTPEAKKYYHVAFYVEIPPFKRVAEYIKLKEFGVTIFPTVILKTDNKRVCFVAVSVRESSMRIAKAVALRKVTILCALLTLAKDSFFKTIHIDWPENRKPIETIDSLDPLPENKSLYPYRRWFECNDEIDFDFKNCIEHITEIYHSLSDPEQTELLDPLFAYYAGKEIQHKQPTLAMISFIAALSAFYRTKQCTAKVKCEKCGLLRFSDGSEFRHYLTGDRESLLNLLCESLRINKGSNEYSELDALLRRVYSKHRSAFVHGSVFRHGEYYKNYNLPKAMPTEESPYSGLLIYQQDLISFERIVRRTLLELLAKKSAISLKYKILKLDELKISSHVIFEASISLPGKTRVGIGTKKDKTR